MLGAAFPATLLDVVLVRIPQDTIFLGHHYTGSPLTTWLQDKQRAASLHTRFFRKFEGMAKVPYDAATTATGGLVSGMRRASHPFQSLGHDPLLGFLFGVADLMGGTGTYIDKAGRVVRVAAGAEPAGLVTGLITQVRHLLSDVSTPAGLQPPLFTLLRLADVQSPLALAPSGVKVPWIDVARYMYVHGYDLRHFASMGTTPFVVEAMIRGYWLLAGYASGRTPEQRKREQTKLRSMLLTGHAIATSGTLLKTGLLFGMNPLALNYAQILAMAPATVA